MSLKERLMDIFCFSALKRYLMVVVCREELCCSLKWTGIVVLEIEILAIRRKYVVDVDADAAADDDDCIYYTIVSPTTVHICTYIYICMKNLRNTDLSHAYIASSSSLIASLISHRLPPKVPPCSLTCTFCLFLISCCC